MAFESSQGITFKFNNVQYTATSIAVSKSRGEFNVTSTDIPSDGGLTRYRAGPLKSMDIKVDWIGSTLPPTSGVYPISVEGSNDPTDGDLGGGAICTGLTITAQAGDLIKGSATFKVTID